MRRDGIPRPGTVPCAVCGALVRTLLVARRAHGVARCVAHRTTPVFRPLTLGARFWSRVDRNGPPSPFAPELGPCWLWTAGKTAAGYGNIGVGESAELAHAVALYLTSGRWPEQEVSHLCHVRACVNPAHLIDESHTANMRRTRAYGRYSPPPHYTGARNPNSTLTQDDVDTLRGLSDTGVPHTRLAERYGISQNHVSRIVHRQSWGHAPPASGLEEVVVSR
jgi:Zinc-binding loop region of homing endonuclease